MRPPVSLIVLGLGAGLGLGACGGAGAGYGCSGSVCTVEADGPAAVEIEPLGTTVDLLELRTDRVVVRIGDATVALRPGDPRTVGRLRLTVEEARGDHVRLTAVRLGG